MTSKCQSGLSIIQFQEKEGKKEIFYDWRKSEQETVIDSIL